MAEQLDIVSDEEPTVDAREPDFDAISYDGDDIAPPSIRRRPRVIKTNSTEKTCAFLAVSKDVFNVKF
jgi:hypothetical protein